MNTHAHNRTFSTIIGVLLCVVLLTPITVSTTHHETFVQLSAHAAGVTPAPATPPQNVGGKATPDNEPSAWVPAVGNVILKIAGYFSWAAGSLLSIAMDKLVFGMGDMLSGSLGKNIELIWGVIRDMSNLAFIFGFMYVGIKTIIDPEKTETKQFLSRIIIGALLINFSLFFVKVVIDFANLTAVQLYNSVAGGGDISLAFAQIFGLSGTFDMPNADTFAKIAVDGLWFYFFGAVILLIAAFVMAAGAILLITRFVALVFIMIFSPILFSATVFPGTSEQASKLWKQLIHNAFFAPIYLLLLLISITVLKAIIESMASDGASMTLSEAFTNTSGSFGRILSFFIAAIFLIKSLTISQKFASAGGDFAVKTAGAATFGVAAWAGRKTIGGGASYISNNDKLKDAASQGGVKGFAARRVLGSSKYVADSSFDVRNASKDMKKSLGEGHKGGFKSDFEASKKKEIAFAESLGHDHGIDDKYKPILDAARTTKAKAMEEKAQMKIHRQTLKNAQRIAADHTILSTDPVKQQALLDIAGLTPLIANHERDLKAVETAEVAKKTEMNARQKNYANKVEGEFLSFNFTKQNKEISEAINKKFDPKKTESENEKLLAEIKKLQGSGGGGGGAPAAPAGGGGDHH
jgi:hypothetical protein